MAKNTTTLVAGNHPSCSKYQALPANRSTCRSDKLAIRQTTHEILLQMVCDYLEKILLKSQ